MPVKLAMMKATNRDRVLIADFTAQRARLGKAKMMRIGWFAAAHYARPLGHELEVVLIAQAKSLPRRAGTAGASFFSGSP
jgi:hypothetical protein